jgi:hypothetical protein
MRSGAGFVIAPQLTAVQAGIGPEEARQQLVTQLTEMISFAHDSVGPRFIDLGKVVGGTVEIPPGGYLVANAREIEYIGVITEDATAPQSS